MLICSMYGMLHTTFTTHLADGNEHSIHGAYDRFESKHDVLYQSPFYGTISTLAMGAGGLDDGHGYVLPYAKANDTIRCF